MASRVKDLNGAEPIGWKTRIDRCPPDCGGADYDEIEYVPVCPSCGYEFSYIDHDNFCRNCGQKLWWKVERPVVLDG